MTLDEFVRDSIVQIVKGATTAQAPSPGWERV